MSLPANKTKIVCTIGPSSESEVVLVRMIEAGMNIARLNFSHGDFDSHARRIETIRTSSDRAGRRVTIMADLPGPKLRIGKLAQEPVELTPKDPFTLTIEPIVGDAGRASVTYDELPSVVNVGDLLFLNDGFIQMRAVSVTGTEVHCRVEVGGELRSGKGLNLPGIDLGISAFTPHDRECLEFALKKGVDAVSQSFVQSARDIDLVRQTAENLGYDPFIIAKIERAAAEENIDAILRAADGIMIARGDLGVETPIERIAIVQKRLMLKANRVGKPVITATQMLESMTNSRLPTRAESTDVANAILDGTDCVMLSGESAVGKYPVEAVRMLAKIAAATEPARPPIADTYFRELDGETDDVGPSDLIALSVATTVHAVAPAVVMAPTRSGASARRITRYRLPVWIVGLSILEETCRRLQFSYGVCPQFEREEPADWKTYAGKWLKAHGIHGDQVVLTQGPSPENPDANNRMEIVTTSG